MLTMKPSYPKIFAILVRDIHALMMEEETSAYHQIALTGLKEGLTTYFFSPNGIDWNRQKVTGYTYLTAEQKWGVHTFPMPHLVYDRYSPASGAEHTMHLRQIQRLKQSGQIRWLGSGLQGKWQLYRVLSNNEQLQRHLPETELYSQETLLRRLRQHRDALLKPEYSSQGRGIVHIQYKDDGIFELRGRSFRNTAFRSTTSKPQRLLQWLDRFMAKHRYLVQAYLPLQTACGHSFDIRVLMQKNADGRWQLTGTGVRLSLSDSITANIHGGGVAMGALPFLEKEWGEAIAYKAVETIRRLSYLTSAMLEDYYGRLAELGIDFGMNRQGKVWLIEVNSKPGRSIFANINDQQAKIRSISSPVLYARYLLDRQLGG